MIKYLQADEKLLCRDLWEEAFREDSASFTDYYFARVLKGNRILADVEEGRVLSMVHLNPYELWVRDRVWRAEYLVGVATRRELRRQGYMRRLLTKGLRDLYGEGMPFCFLMPADEAIYKPFGFTYIAESPGRELAEADNLRRRAMLPGWRGEEGGAADIGEISEWMERWLRRHYQVFALRGKSYLLRLLQEIASEDGTFDILYDGREIAAMESIWGLEEREPRLVYGDPPYVRELSEAKPAIMGRILCLREFIRMIRLRDRVKAEKIVIPLQVRDALIPENDGNWLWHLDHGTSRLERAETSGGLRLGIDELAAWLFGYRIPQAAEEYRDTVDVLEGVLLDEVV